MYIAKVRYVYYRATVQVRLYNYIIYSLISCKFFGQPGLCSNWNYIWLGNYFGLSGLLGSQLLKTETRVVNTYTHAAAAVAGFQVGRIRFVDRPSVRLRRRAIAFSGLPKIRK